MDQQLAALADAYGVATHYENWEQREVEVDADVVVAVLAQFGVDAASADAIARELAAVRATRAAAALPPTLVVRAGRTHPIDGRAEIRLEDGSTRAVSGEIPGDLPLGWHRVVTDTQDVVLAVVPERLPEPPPAWGWMVQLYAVHSAGSWGLGDFADLAELTTRSADELGVDVLLVNPVQAIAPTHPVERSPYSPASRRFVNPLYLRVTDLPAFAAAPAEVQARVRALRPPAGGELIDYDAVWTAKLAALELLWPHSPAAQDTTEDTAHDADHGPDDALTDFATYCALAERHGDDWQDWPAALRDPHGPGVAQARADLAERVRFHEWVQRMCQAQLDAVRAAAEGMAVGVVHDLPVGVRPGGADTWALGDAFAADVRVGAPPDAFSTQGQDWNLPPWRPDRLAELGYAPFRDVLRGVLRHADGIRVDHVAGLWRLWWIPPGEPANRGTYVHYDAEAMVGILALEAHRAGAVVVGEDLGTVEPIVTETMHERGLLSSAVLWFQRDWEDPAQPFIPPRDWDPAAMASIATHDLATATGWLTAENVRVRAELGLTDDPEAEYATARADRAALVAELVAEGALTGSAEAAEQAARDGESSEDLLVGLHALLASAASRLVLTSPADVLGERRQPNLPGTTDEYPNWRIPLPVSLAEFLADPRVRRVVAPLRAARPHRGSRRDSSHHSAATRRR